jgi:hypothetical protein
MTQDEIVLFNLIDTYASRLDTACLKSRLTRVVRFTGLS